MAITQDAERSAPSDILRQHVFLVAPCANRSRRHYGHPPVVTSREMPQPTRVWRALAQVKTPSDGLTARQICRPCNAICLRPLHAGHFSRSATWRTPEPWEDGSPRWNDLQQQSAIGAKPRAAEANG